MLAAIGKVETDHGRLQAPGVTSGANFAGAAGPMQIGIGGKAGNTWGAYAIDADGGGASVYSPVDAIYTAANYLCQNGASKGADVAGAVFAYNHANWYVTKVLAIASTYAASQGLPPGAPAEEVAAAAVQYAYDQLGKPYRWGATGEQGFYDCSGLTQAAYKAGGLAIPRVSRDQWNFGARVWNVADLQPGDLVFYAYNTADPTTIHHVGMYIGAGNMIDAPHRRHHPDHPVPARRLRRRRPPHRRRGRRRHHPGGHRHHGHHRRGLTCADALSGGSVPS